MMKKGRTSASFFQAKDAGTSARRASTLGQALTRKNDPRMDHHMGGQGSKSGGRLPTATVTQPPQPQGRVPLKHLPSNAQVDHSRIRGAATPQKQRPDSPGPGVGSPRSNTAIKQMQMMPENSRMRGAATPQKQRPNSPGPGVGSPRSNTAIATRQQQQFGLSTLASKGAKGAGKGGGKGAGKSTLGSPGLWDSTMSPLKAKSARTPFSDWSTMDTARVPAATMTMAMQGKPCEWDLQTPRIDKIHSEGRLGMHPQPVAGTVGKFRPPERYTDPRCASSLAGGAVVSTDQDGGLDCTRALKETARRSEKLMQEEEQGTVMNMAFTDRHVRSMQGSAMQTLLAGDGVHHLEPEYNQTEKMDNCAKVAAGQVVQVDIGHKGKPPYILQAEWPGITPQFATLKNLSSLGRVMYNRQLEKNEIIKEGVIARGCQPEEKQPDPNRMSRSMRAALQYIEHEGGEEEREYVARKELGMKKLVEPRPDNIHVVNYGDGIKPRSYKNYNLPSHPGRITHHFTDEGIMLENTDKAMKVVNKELAYRNPGEFKQGPSEWTVWKNSKLDLARFENENHTPMKRCVSAPPSQLNGGPVTHFLHGEDADQGSPKPKQISHTPSFTCSPNGMDATLKHLTLEEVAIAREAMLSEDHKFLDKCQRVAQTHRAMRQVAVDNRRNHITSSSMADVLKWNADPN